MASGNQVNLLHQYMQPPQAPYISGLDQFAEEVAACFGGQQELTQRAPVNIEVTLPPTVNPPAAANRPALQVDAHRPGVPEGDAIAIDTTGLIYENGQPLAASILFNGCIQMYAGNPADLPLNWYVMDGIQNVAGTGWDLTGYFVRGGTPAAPTGATSTSSATTGITVSDHAGGSTGAASPGGSFSGTASGSTDNANPTGTVSGTIGYSASLVTVNAATGNTGNSTTGITATASGDSFHAHTANVVAVDSTGTGAYGFTSASGASDGQSIAHTHSISDGGHGHTLGSHVHGITDPTHTHSLSGASVTIDAHYHAVTSLACSGSISVTSHTHTSPTLTHAVNDAGHGHTTGNPAYVTLYFIEYISP